MISPKPKTSKLDITLLVLVFVLIVPGCFLVSNISANKGKKFPAYPRLGQVPTIQLSQPSYTNITILQGQEYQINWTIQGGMGKNYRVTQIGEYVAISFNFGLIDTDPFPVYAPVNSSVPGSYVVRVEVYNATDSFASDVGLVIVPDPALRLQQFILIAVGSVAVATSIVAGYRVWKWHKTRRPRHLTGDTFAEGDGIHRSLTAKEKLFLSSTEIALVAICTVPSQASPVENFTFETFQDIDQVGTWKEAIFKAITGLFSQILPCKNIQIKINDATCFLTCIPYEHQNRGIVIVSTDILDNKFLSLIYVTTKLLTRRDPGLIDNPPEFLDKFARILHLERSYPYIFSRSSKLRSLQRSIFWTSQRDPQNDLTPPEMHELEDDLDYMTQAAVENMVAFLDRVGNEFDQPAAKEPT
ncbi:MAG: hypothetical protein RBG13Loki_2649 [Promethearchaeota archaeon CR_4]|nr:MAG: hypothetical protein RBG13Loki_2649 [Candidatus Lokiarchaeota archaeon CR_4]